MKDKLCLFSGDLFAPSLLSTTFLGEQMVQVFDRLNFDVSCLGNHDLEYGIPTFKKLIDKSPKTKWIMSNLGVKPMGDPNIPDIEKLVSGCLKSHIIEDCQGLKVGFFGLAEKEWLDMMSPEVEETLYY
jgi:5'-nucleotidase